MSHYDTLSLLIALGFVLNSLFVGTIGWIAGRRYERLVNPPENIRPLFPIPPRYEEGNPIDWTELPLCPPETISTDEMAAYGPPDESVDNT